jgi:erythromycin esterase-like protein
MRRSWLVAGASCIFALLGASHAVNALATGEPDGAQYSTVPFDSKSIPRARQPTIIAVGEASHGGEPMLFARNHLIRELALEGRISRVALETGYAEALLLDRFVRGGPGTPSEVATKGFTHGFGSFAGNVALLEDLRAINLRKPVGKQIGIVGVDLSLEGPWGSAPSMEPIECALSGVRNVTLRESLHDSFSKAVIPGLTKTAVSDQEKTLFHALSKQLESSIAPDATQSERRCAFIVAQSAIALDAQPTHAARGSVPSDTWRMVDVRDEAMASNASSALADANGGSILLFAHTSHILNAPMVGGRFNGQSQPPHSMGETLHRALGSRYVTIVQVQPVTSPPSNGVSDLFQIIHPTCEDPCMVRSKEIQLHQVRIGNNDNDQQLIDPTTAASYYLFLPKTDQ